jgi:hypothetical protein
MLAKLTRGTPEVMTMVPWERGGAYRFEKVGQACRDGHPSRGGGGAPPPALARLWCVKALDRAPASEGCASF